MHTFPPDCVISLRGSCYEWCPHSRRVGAGRDLWRSSSPSPCQGLALERVHRSAQGGFCILAGKENQQPLHSLLQCSVTLKVSQFFLIFSWKFLYFSLCLLSLETQNFLAGPSIQGPAGAEVLHPGDRAPTTAQPLCARSSNSHTGFSQCLTGI